MIRINIFWLVCILGGILNLSAGTQTWDFETDPVDDFETIITSQPNVVWGGQGNDLFQAQGNPGGFLSITEATFGTSTIAILPDIDGGLAIEALTMEMDLRIGNGFFRPADGFSINFARDFDPMLQNPSPNSSAVPNQLESGTSTGLSISFDTWAGNILPDGADIEGIIVRLDNQTLAKYAMPTRNGAGNDVTSIQTGPYDRTNNPNILSWQPLSVQLDKFGILDVTYKNHPIVSGFQTGFPASPGNIVLMGRTGGAHEHHHIDNLTLTTQLANQSPTISQIDDFNIRPISVNLPRNFGISDAETSSDNLTVGVQFDGGDQALFNDLEISFTGTDGDRSIQINAPNHRVGYVDIDVIVSDTDGGMAHEDVRIIVANPAGLMAFSPQGFIRANEFHVPPAGGAILPDALENLINHPNYPNSPDAVFHPIHFEWPTGPSGSEENSTAFPPSDVRDDYGTQIQGFYHANRTGPHFFAIASDNMGELFLSTDDSFANLQLIAEEPAWNQVRDFGTPARRPMLDVGTPDERQSNWSKGIFLEQGRAYAIMARVYEHGGGDNLAVAHNDQMFFWDGMDPIPGSFLSADLQGNQGGPLIAPIPDQEVTVNTTIPPIDLFLGDLLFPGRDIEVRVESDNQFILPNEDILLGRPGQDILLGEQPNDLLLPGGETLPLNSPPFGGGNDLLNGNGPATALLGQGIEADQIDHRVILLPPLRRTGSANLTVIATNPNGDERRLQFGISIISNEILLIDDGDAGFSTSGVWGPSNALFSQDEDSLISNHAGSTAKYTPNLPGPGTYAVYAKWASRNPNGGQYNRDHGARYTVNHAGGSMTTTINQTQNDGKFNLLGIYDFVGDGSDCVILERVNVIGGFTSADAIRFVATTSTNGNEQPGDLIVDNLSPGFSTSSHWHSSNAIDGYAGGSLFTEVVGNMATFTPGIAPNGIYEVYVHASARNSRGRNYRRDSKAQFEVRHAMGTSLVEVNQNVLPGQWIFIGAFHFDPTGDASVKLTRTNENSLQKTVADAVRFTPLQPIRSTEVIVDNKDAGFSSFGNWIESNALDEYLQSSLAGFGAGTSARWTPELPSAGKYEVFARWANQGSNGPLLRDSRAWYSVQNSGGKPSIVRVNQNANGGNWVSIGTFDFTGDGSEFVEIFSGFASQASISADAIRFLLVE